MESNFYFSYSWPYWVIRGHTPTLYYRGTKPSLPLVPSPLDFTNTAIIKNTVWLTIVAGKIVAMYLTTFVTAIATQLAALVVIVVTISLCDIMTVWSIMRLCSLQGTQDGFPATVFKITINSTSSMMMPRWIHSQRYKRHRATLIPDIKIIINLCTPRLLGIII